MKYIFLICLAIMALNVSGQKIRFCNPSNIWSTSGTYQVCPFTNRIWYGADTVVSGNSYHIIRDDDYRPFPPSGCTPTAGIVIDQVYYVREDTLAGIVYYRFPIQDTAEHVLYNYNLVPGDTIGYYIYEGGSASVYITDSVVALDTVIIEGIPYKFFAFMGSSLGVSAPRTFNVIEGIGCLNAPFFPDDYGICFEYGENLDCFSENGHYTTIPDTVTSLSYIYGSCAGTGVTFTNSCALKTTDVTRKLDATFFPNPATDRVTIELPKIHQAALIRLKDLLGCTLSDVHLPQGPPLKYELNVTHAPPGFYLLEIEIDGVCSVHKLVVE